MVFDPEKSPSLPNNELLEETVVKSESDLAPVRAPFESKIDINKAKNLGLSEKRIQELIDYEQSKYEKSLVDKAPETKPEVTTEPVRAPFESKIDINKAKNLGLFAFINSLSTVSRSSGLLKFLPFLNRFKSLV